jgi:hypothetical protein
MRIQFSLLFYAAALTAFSVISLHAQEIDQKQPVPADMGVINDLDVTITDLTEEKLNNPPKREIKFERLTEPLKSQLPKPDPKLFEQKFVAKFELEIHQANFGSNYLPLDDNGRLPKYAYLGRTLMINPRLGFGRDGRGESYAGSFSTMIKELPAADAPAKEEREFFSDPKNTEGMLTLTSVSANTSTPDAIGWRVTILGTSAELVERRSKALLTIFDLGSCRPVQLAILKVREPLCEQVRDQRKTLEAARRVLNVVEDELKSSADFTPDMLADLRVQQLQLEVDLAGVKARIAACDRLLAGSALKAERRSQIEDVKVAAEIELAGFEARLRKSSEFVALVKNKVDLLSKQKTAQFKQRSAQDRIAVLEAGIKNIDEAIHAFSPLSLVGNKIVIQPIEWTQ